MNIIKIGQYYINKENINYLTHGQLFYSPDCKGLSLELIIFTKASPPIKVIADKEALKNINSLLGTDFSIEELNV